MDQINREIYVYRFAMVEVTRVTCSFLFINRYRFHETVQLLNAVHVDRFSAKICIVAVSIDRYVGRSCSRLYNTIRELRAQARIHLITRIAYH